MTDTVEGTSTIEVSKKVKSVDFSEYLLNELQHIVEDIAVHLNVSTVILAELMMESKIAKKKRLFSEPLLSKLERELSEVISITKQGNIEYAEILAVFKGKVIQAIKGRDLDCPFSSKLEVDAWLKDLKIE